MQNRLWYNSPSASWTEGLPIGNGRLAAMVWGTKTEDVLSLNHEWLWRGVYRNREVTECAEHLKDIRELLLKGDFLQATSLANAYYGGSGGVSKEEPRIDSYQPAGDMIFSIKNVTHYLCRQLDIFDAVAKIDRETNSASVESIFIAHPEHNLIIGRWESVNGPFSGELSFIRAIDEKASYVYDVTDNMIEFYCSFEGGLSYLVDIFIKTNGKTVKNMTSINIEEATELLVYINIATDVKGIKYEQNRYPVPDLKWDDLLKSHIKVFNKRMCNLQLEIDLPKDNLATDIRIKNNDPSLLLVFFNYGRYLLTSSSICAELPANLQGKWNHEVNPPWECDYHFDINLQMNYWMCEAAGMHECVDALINYIERIVPYARIAAHSLYGCKGICFPITNDAWGKATPEACGWAVWIGAAPWIAQHLWWHYLYNGDIDYLRERAYPFFKEIAEFYDDYLIEDDKGILQVMPSQSPENRFYGTGEWPVSIGISSAMDVQLAYDVLGYAINSGKILKIDQTEIKHWENMQLKLPPFRIGCDGRLIEWDKERLEVEPGHRHLSHLYGLYPSDLFNPIDRPAQYEAAIKSLKERLSHGGGHTGWSRAHVACLFARIGESEEVWEHLQALLRDFTTTSLLDLHPPHIFQIDGNLGACAAVFESLVQSWGGKIHILPALPNAWKKGSVKGIKVPGGHILNIKWNDGKPTSIEICLGYSQDVCIADIAPFTHYSVDDNASVEIKENDIIIRGKIGTLIRIDWSDCFA